MSRGGFPHTEADPERADGRRWALGAPAVAARPLALAALAVVGAWTGFRALHNAPVELPGVVLGAAPWLAPAAGLVPGIAAVVLGLRSPGPAERVGLLFAGVFGALATVVPAATLPAAAALVGGGGVAVLGHRRSVGGWRGSIHRLVPVALLGAVALSLGATTGLLPSGVRAAGSTLAVAGLAATPALVRPGPGGWALGALAAGGVLWAGWTLPFVTGAVTLVAFGLVGTPLVGFAAGVGGCVATVAGTLRRREAGEPTDRRRGIGAALVLLAGAPSTAAAATAVVLGAALVAGVGTGGGRR